MLPSLRTTAQTLLLFALLPALAFGQSGTTSRIQLPKEGTRQPGIPVTEIEPGAAASGPDRARVKKEGRFQLDFEKVEIDKLVQTMSDLTGKLFILPENLRGTKISIIGPEHGKTGVTVDEAYAAFLAALDAANLTIYETGRYTKIVEKRQGKQTPLRTVLDGEKFALNEQMVTRLVRLKYVDSTSVKGLLLNNFTTRDADIQEFGGDLLIITDLGNNQQRLARIIEQIDQPSTSDQIHVLKIEYATASEVAEKLQQIFDDKGKAGGGAKPAASQPSARRRGVRQPPQPAATVADGASGGGEESNSSPSLSLIIPDDRTNKLIIVANDQAFERIQMLLKHLDAPVAGEGQVRVYYLANANAEELASTLSSIIQGTGSTGGSAANRRNASNRPSASRAPPAPGAATGAAESFTGEVKVTADKGTNSLVILANNNDYRSLVKVIEKLDIARRQVFVEAVIMEVNLEDNTDFGVSTHGGDLFDIQGKQSPAVLGSQIGGAKSLGGIMSLASMSGFLAGLQGPAIDLGSNLSIPAFSVVLQALQKSTDVNVLSTPHILTSDNEEAEISVGQNVPFQSGYSSALGSLGSSSSLGNLSSSLGGLGSLLGGYGTIQRTNVELKLKIKPQINESDFIRLEIEESTEEIASQDAMLGPTTAKRSAKTTVVARDQQSVVIGGLIQERTVNSVEKVPLLGDIPVLGHLFRSTSKKKQKTNLLLFLTPYIVRDQADFRRIFERKMKERQAFVEQFYGRQPGYEVPIDYDRKAGPFTRMLKIRQDEMDKLENGGEGRPDEKLVKPQGSGGPHGAARTTGDEPPSLLARPAEGTFEHEIIEGEP
ncbi:MAG: type II secretion system secretin GspD [Myxococcales bacterium]|jgi:general secretion pathway protein D|nr:type II secretion system secretin GspD [Myxococcales bacterium]